MANSSSPFTFTSDCCVLHYLQVELTNVFLFLCSYCLLNFFHVSGTPYNISPDHACFLFYHTTSNMTLRKLRHSTAHLPQFLRWSFEAAWVLALSYFIAYLETLAIANFPYYEFIDRDIMYKVGSLFYAIYFIVSFPMFSRIDENEEKWSLSRVAVDALGAAMLVTIILDLWRIFLGPIVPIPESRRCGQPGLAWFQVQNESV